jgi:hypothetical protein
LPEAPLSELIHENEPGHVILFVGRHYCGKKIEEDIIDCAIGLFQVFFNLGKAGDGFLSPNTHMISIIF